MAPLFSFFNGGLEYIKFRSQDDNSGISRDKCGLPYLTELKVVGKLYLNVNWSG